MGSVTLGSRAGLSSGNIISYVNQLCFLSSKNMFYTFSLSSRFRLYRGNISVAQETLIIIVMVHLIFD